MLIQQGSGWSVDEAEHVAGTAIEVLDASGDEFGQCRAWCLRATVKWILGRSSDADQAWIRAADHAERAGNTRDLFEILCWRASAAASGPTPVDAAIHSATRFVTRSRAVR